MEEIINLINEETFIISDLHFGHKQILTMEQSRQNEMINDGFTNHEEWLIHKWNSVVSMNDTVLCLGDFAFNNVDGYSKELNGNKILILGNHDSKTIKHKTKEWKIIDGMYIKDRDFIHKILNDDVMFSCLIKEINNKRILFSHYPVFNENNEYDSRNPEIVKRTMLFEKLFIQESCDLNIHGHLHSNINSFYYAKNVSFEKIGFQPIRLKEIL